MKTYIFAALVLLLAFAAACSTPATPTIELVTVTPKTPAPRPQPAMTLNPEDPSRLLLPLNEGLRHSMFQCGPNVWVTTTFQGFTQEEKAIIDGKEYAHGDRLIVEPPSCNGKKFDVGWINIVGKVVYYQAEDEKEIPSVLPTATSDALSLPTPVKEPPLQAFIAGHEIILTAIAESLANVKEQAAARGFTIMEGKGTCYKPGEKYPVRFEIHDASVGNGLFVRGTAEGDVAVLSATEEVYGVFIKYANTERWGFLPLFYHGPTSSVQKCVMIIPLKLNGPASTIPSDPPRE